MKEDQLVHRRRCRYVEGRWTWDDGEREQQHGMKL
jgi:hypothetical protein